MFESCVAVGGLHFINISLLLITHVKKCPVQACSGSTVKKVLWDI